ncbi:MULTISPECIES: class I adenylate-forming enzyme family protein [Nocardia]|jgi:acyl-CoA synthetase (AMP-forming)/AMP-acid ligase II|uniref:AMP-dependent synthetase n=2 Tax=Nocardia TaxID=1817 RepID=A0A2T2ZBZ6_9NOCA|nr:MULTISPECIES: long-chain fatty acid--CoA ligase [Nocardia]MDN2496780.1 AMP-binding protein [Nocardia nova]PSR65270.1 AMP-dependent synthetase [Nocardia nova]
MNLTMLLDMAIDGFGDRVVIGRREGGITAARLAEMAATGAAAIRESGADSVVYLAVNGPAFPVAMFAAARAGVPLVPVNYRLGAEQLQSLLANHPRAIGIADDAQLPTLQAAGLSVLTPEQWLVRTAEPAFADASPDLEETDAPAVVIYTSGTTSAPKGVLLRHENLTSYVFGSVEFASAEPSDAALISVPPYHIAAVANAITSLYSGRRTLVLERFTPGQWLRLAREEEITNALVVPTMLARIVDSDEDKALPSLRSLAYGGAPMPTSVIEKALRMWPEVGFVNAYGLTETSSTVAVLGPEDHRAALASDEPAVRARLGSVGRVVPGVDLEIRDVDDAVVAPGITGSICVRGEQVSAEYAGIGRAVDARGFFNTRDQGYVDEDGYLYIGGRMDDTIIRGAENIAPAEIEDVILRHPAVLDTAVVGVPDEEWGQRIEAAVVVRPGMTLDPDELRAHVRSVLRGSKTPERIVYWDELPRTETGKLVRRHVLERIVADDVAV